MSKFIRSYTGTSTTFKEMVEYKIKSLEKLHEIRDKQTKLINAGKINGEVPDWKEYDLLEAQLLPKLQEVFPYADSNKLWDIENSNIEQLHEMLQKEI